MYIHIYIYACVCIFIIYTYIFIYLYICVYINIMAPADFQFSSWARKISKTLKINEQFRRKVFYSYYRIKLFIYNI